MLNPTFAFHDQAYEQRIIEDLAVEAIAAYGIQVLYMPRTAVAEDPLFGEDPLSRFQLATPLEMYFKTAAGFGGAGDFLSKFGNQIEEEIVLQLARRRWDQARVGANIVLEDGTLIQLESANTAAPGNASGLLLESANGYQITYSRPYEGDLVYVPFLEEVFEVKFCDHQHQFYQLGKLQTYELTLESWRYSSERVETGNTAVDQIFSALSLDANRFELLLETGDQLLDEEGDPLIAEFNIEDQDGNTSNNQYFTSKSYEIIDYREKSPFSQRDTP